MQPKKPGIAPRFTEDAVSAPRESKQTLSGPQQYIVRSALLALLYLAAAWGGHFVALSTTYASPLWPAAGIALAGLLVWGMHYWPAIWLAGFFTELFIAPSGGHWLASIGTASGITLQAVIATRLAHHYLSFGEESRYSERRLACAILACGPIASIVSSSIGVVSHLLGGAIETTEAFENWLVWWAGDTTGVLLFAPVALAMWPGNHQVRLRWEGGWRIAIVPAVTALLLVTGLVQITRLDASRTQAEAMRSMDIIGDRSLLALSGALEPLHGIVRLFEASESVTRDEFRLYAAGLRRHPSIIGIDWAPRVTAEERTSFETAVRSSGLSEYFLFEFDRAHAPRPAGLRTEYFPVLYSEPSPFNNISLGLDHAYSAERRNAMNRALNSPGSAHVVRDDVLRTQNASLLVFLPVFQRQSSMLSGYVVGILDLELLLASLIDDAARQQLAFRIYDLSPGAPPRALFDAIPASHAPDLSRELEVGGMLWRIDMARVNTQRDRSAIQVMRGYLGFSVFAALLVAFAVAGSAGHNAATTARVRERTTELAGALARLNDREAEERAVLDNIVECVVTIDADGSVLNINRAVKPMFGYEPDEVIGRNVSMLMPAHEAAAHDGYLRRYLNTGERRIIGRNREVVGRHKNGREIALELAVSEYVFGERRVFTGTLRDITERKALVADLTRARENADEANRAKSAFLAAMSHEIRTPMNGVVGLIDVLARSNLDEYQRDLVRIIRESSTSLLTLIDDILDFSKIEAGRLDIEYRPLHLTDVIEGVCSSLSPVAVRRGVDVSLFIDPSLPAGVISDEVRLRQLLYNIVGNAIKFSAGRPDVRGAVSLRVTINPADPQRVCFTVADNGIGIAPERLNDLFRPFTQAESSTTRRFGGTGLGLAICRRLVDMLGGDIAVDSEIGRGSTFRITLPLETADEIVPPPLPELNDLDCLIAPCCGAEGDTVEVYLQHAGARVHRPINAAEALGIARQSRHPLVMIDCVREGSPQEAAFALPGIDVRGVRLVRGHSSATRIDAQNQVGVDANVLRRAALLRAVAIAAGRASPEPHPAVCTDSISKPDMAQQSRPILVAEDNEINQKVILHQLALLGYTAEIAEDGAQALSLWQAGDYCLVLTDLHMPIMDGYALTSAIRSREAPGRHTPILALTANALRGEERRALDAGMDAYLTKPIQLDELRRTLDNYLRSGTAEAQQPPHPTPASTGEDSHALPIFDISVLKELVGDEPAVLLEFLQEFQRSASALTESLENALTGGWVGEAGNAAHKLKSAARSVGALALGEECALIESKARTGDGGALTERLLRIKALHQTTRHKIDAYLKEAKTP